MKLNFDGAFKGNPSPLGVGCIVRDNKETVLGSLAVALLEGTNNAAKFQALILGLNLCRELKVGKMVIEGDSSLVINALRSKKILNWKLGDKLEVALGLLEGFDQVMFNHILREGNVDVDLLSNMGVVGPNRKVIGHAME